MGNGFAFLFHLDFMGTAGQAGNGDACGEADGNFIGTLRGGPFLQVRTCRPLISPACFRGRAGIPWAGHGGEHKLVNPVPGGYQFGVVQFNSHRIPGHYIGHIHGKYIGTLLLQQRGAFSLAFSFLEFCFGLFPFLYFCRDYLVPDFHFHSMYRNPGRCREHVAGIDGYCPFVGIGLVDIGFGNDAVYCGGHTCVLQGELVCRLSGVLYKEIGGKGLVRRIPVRFLTVDRSRGQGQHKQCQTYIEPGFLPFHCLHLVCFCLGFSYNPDYNGQASKWHQRCIIFASYEKPSENQMKKESIDILYY